MNLRGDTHYHTDFLISYNEWTRLIKVKREKRINLFNKGPESQGITLDKTNQSKLFNNVISNLARKNIFDVSRISYLAILFLDPFITPHLKYYLETETDITIINTINKGNTSRDYLPPLDKAITHILVCLVELLIFIELQLNILLFTLQMQLQLSNQFSNHLDNHHSNLISPSTLLLLVFNIITKLGGLPLNMLGYMGKNLDNASHYINKIMPKLQLNNRKMNILLDKFILDINMNQKNNGDSQGDRLWQLCKSHILDIAQANLEIFSTLLDLIIELLIQENQEQHDKLLSIHNSIINFLKLEINLFDHKLEQMPQG